MRPPHLPARSRARIGENCFLFNYTYTHSHIYHIRVVGHDYGQKRCIVKKLDIIVTIRFFPLTEGLNRISKKTKRECRVTVYYTLYVYVYIHIEYIFKAIYGNYRAIMFSEKAHDTTRY